MAEEFGEAILETEVSLESGEVQWMRQGVVIQPGPRHKLAQNGCKRTLTITNLNLSDRGTYRCETLHDRTQVKLNVERKCAQAFSNIYHFSLTKCNSAEIIHNPLMILHKIMHLRI